MSFPFIPDFSNLGKKKKSTLDVNPDNIDFSSAQTIPQQGGGLGGGLSAILNAIASGVGVGISSDPGAALMQQLSQIKQQQMQRAQMAAEDSRQQREIQSQQKLEDIRIKAQKDIQTSEHTFKKEEGAGADAQQLLVQANQFKNAKEMQDSQTTATRQLAELNDKFNKENASNNQDWQEYMQGINQTGDLQNTMAKSTMGALFHAMQNSRYVKGAPISMKDVVNISSKIGNGEDLDKADTDAIDRAMKAQGLAMAAAAKASKGSNVNTKSDNSIILSRLKGEQELAQALALKAHEAILNPDGSPKMDMSGRIQYKYATPEAQAQFMNEGMANYRAALGNPVVAKSEMKQQAAQNNLDNSSGQSATVNATVDNLANQGMSLQQINQMIDSSGMNDAQKRQAKARAVTKTKKSSTGKVF